MPSIIRNSEVLPLIEPEQVKGTLRSGRYMVVIFNNETNTFDEVTRVLMEATGCDVREAAIETWEAHTYGQAAVHFATEAECRTVASVVNRVGVRTEVRREWDE